MLVRCTRTTSCEVGERERDTERERERDRIETEMDMHICTLHSDIQT